MTETASARLERQREKKLPKRDTKCSAQRQISSMDISPTVLCECNYELTVLCISNCSRRSRVELFALVCNAVSQCLVSCSRPGAARERPLQRSVCPGLLLDVRDLHIVRYPNATSSRK